MIQTTACLLKRGRGRLWSFFPGFMTGRVFLQRKAYENPLTGFPLNHS
jgi:hypothetical protein